MTNQVETPGLFPGVYQWETADPVVGGLGGLANLPLLQLTQRTRYLNDILSGVIASLAGYAPINSPIFTGSPKAPTPAIGAAGAEIVTAQFLRSAVSGVLGIDVTTGNHVLSSVEAGFGIFNVQGTPGTDPYLLLPAQTGKWIAINNTARRLLVRQAAGGTTVVIQPSRVRAFWSDGGNVLAAITDFDSIAMTGVPTAPTPPDGDASALVSTTAFVKRAIDANNANLLPGALTANGGYQKFPSGLIVQFGNNTTVTGNGDYFAFPIAFPNGMVAGVVSEGNPTGWSTPLSGPTIYGMKAGRSPAEFRLSGVTVPAGAQAGQSPVYSNGINFSYIAWGF